MAGQELWASESTSIEKEAVLGVVFELCSRCRETALGRAERSLGDVGPSG